MVFHSFDRQILVATESTEGTSALGSPAASNVVDCLADVDVDFNVVRHERNLVRPGWTPVPDFFASTDISSGSMVATASINFTVEFSLKSGSTPVSTAPAWAPLLKACGCSETTGIKRIGTGGSLSTGDYMYNNEYLVVSATDEGQLFGTTFDRDTYAYYTIAGTGISASDAVTGSVSTSAFTASGSETAVGIGYRPDTTTGAGDDSSATIMLYWAGRRYTFVGCRGSVSFTFASTNRVLMAFSMQGVVDSVANGARFTGVDIGHALPSTFLDASLKLNEHGSSTAFGSALFSSLTWDMGNEVVLREDANSANGYKAAQIVGRSGSVSLDPDAVVGGSTSSTVLDFFKFLSVGTSCRAEWKVGDGMNAQSGLFRMPALQFDDIGMTDRDKVEVYDLSAMVTGGLIGDSVTPADGDVQHYADRGADNEFSIVLY